MLLVSRAALAKEMVMICPRTGRVRARELTHLLRVSCVARAEELLIARLLLVSNAAHARRNCSEYAP